MIDLTFVHKLECALDNAVSTAMAGAPPEKPGCATCNELIRKICKNAAQRLFFELDGKTLLELGMSKLAAERQIGEAMPAQNASAA